MGGLLNFVKIKDSQVETQIVSTNAVPAYFDSYRFHFGSYDQQMELFNKIFHLSIQREESGVAFAPYGYGIIVVDYDRKEVRDCQGYCDCGVIMGPKFGSDHYMARVAAAKAHLKAKRELGEKFWNEFDQKFRPIDSNNPYKLSEEYRYDLFPLFLEKKLTMMYHSFFDKTMEEIEAGEKTSKIIELRDRKWPYSYWKLDLQLSDIGTEFPFLLSRAEDQSWFKRNKDSVPDRFKNLMEQKREHTHLEFIVDSDWKFYQYMIDAEGIGMLQKDLGDLYSLSKEDEKVWNEFVQEYSN